MTNSTHRRSTLLAAMAFWPASADAQTTAGSFEELAGIGKAEAVLVIDVSGRRVKGALTAVDEDSLSLATRGGARTLARSEVRAVRMADGLGNGALIGAGAGLGAALAILAIAGSGDGYILPSAKVGAPLLLSGSGALIGILLDRAHEGGRFLYLSPSQRSGVVVSPLVGRDHQGVVVSVRF